jgi:predicted peptidase
MTLRHLASAIILCGPLTTLAFTQSPDPDPGLDTPPPTPSPLRFQALKDPTPLPSSPFVRYFTTDTLDRVITFYVFEPSLNDQPSSTKLPVILYIQGSGSQSVFTRVERDGTSIAGASGGQGIIRKVARDRAIVVITEKPGVKFLERPSRPGSAEEGSQLFRDEHTLPRWTTAVHAALNATLTLPNADASRVLVVGHSEGGLVASVAGGGPTQLYDLLELARSGTMCGSKPRSSDECVDWLLAQWSDVLKAPESANDFFLGHPHRRWTSFLATSPLDELKKTSARVFIAQGTDDTAVYPPSADVLFATLKAANRDVTYARVPGDHAFMTSAAPTPASPDGWEAIHARVVNWFLAD